MMNEIQISKLKTLLCIIPPEKEKELAEALFGCGARAVTSYQAQGAAPSDLKDFLGLADNSKVLTLAFVRAEDVTSIRQMLLRQFYCKPGVGLAMVVKVDGFIGAKTTFNYINVENEGN